MKHIVIMNSYIYQEPSEVEALFLYPEQNERM